MQSPDENEMFTRDLIQTLKTQKTLGLFFLIGYWKTENYCKNNMSFSFVGSDPIESFTFICSAIVFSQASYSISDE